MVRKRAAGGGRKPKGAAPGAPLTIRMPPDLRADLEAAAKKGDRYLSEEILGRLRRSFSKPKEWIRNDATESLLIMFAYLAAPWETDKEQEFWVRDPFMYKAFKLAVVKFLDIFEPPGEVRSPTVHLRPNDPQLTRELAEEFKTPESAADYTVRMALTFLSNIFPLTADDRDTLKRGRDWGETALSALDRQAWRLSLVRHVLGLNNLKEPKK